MRSNDSDNCRARGGGELGVRAVDIHKKFLNKYINDRYYKRTHVYGFLFSVKNTRV